LSARTTQVKTKVATKNGTTMNIISGAITNGAIIPEIPKTAKILKMLEPITSPTSKSQFFFFAAEIATEISGRDVPMAIKAAAKIEAPSPVNKAMLITEATQYFAATSIPIKLNPSKAKFL